MVHLEFDCGLRLITLDSKPGGGGGGLLPQTMVNLCMYHGLEGGYSNSNLASFKML